ncbi:MAG: hypothetical protein RL531_1727 [Actinomycetota bacterium]
MPRAPGRERHGPRDAGRVPSPTVMQRSRRLLAVVIIALVLGALAFAVVLPRRTLTDRRAAADAAFTALRPSLDARYATVPGLLSALDGAGARDRTPVRSLRRSLAGWTAAARGADPIDLTDAANRVEGDVARTRALVGASPALTAVVALRDAYTGYDRALPAPQLVRANTDAVEAYDAARRGLLRRVAVAVGGFEARPVYLPVTP